MGGVLQSCGTPLSVIYLWQFEQKAVPLRHENES
jgi:hypothetical protein